MRKLLCCRRGTSSLMIVCIMVPLITVVALGGEAGTWYVTKQHAQNAADAAAYAGGLKRACEIGAQSGMPCADAQSVSYRGRQFAAQNAFCNAGDASYPGATCKTALTQTVVIEVGTYSSGRWTTVAGGSFVRASITQQQPAYLAAVLGSQTVSIGAYAIAEVNNLANPCVLSLTGSISFQGSPNINGPNCGMASNDTAQNALSFTGGGTSMNLGSLSTAGGCTGSAALCDTALTHMPPVTNPFSALDAVTLPTLGNCTNSGALTPYSAATPCRNNNVTLNDPGNNPITLTSGVYFISGTLTVKGNNPYTGSALFILLPGASFDMRGVGSFNVTGLPTVAANQLPTALQPYAGLFANMAIYDKSNLPINIGGGSALTFNGTMYLPNAAVAFQGNPTVNACGELIAASISFAGNATFNNTGCSAATKPGSMYVSLVR